jgi:hypothetical protein
LAVRNPLVSRHTCQLQWVWWYAVGHKWRAIHSSGSSTGLSKCKHMVCRMSGCEKQEGVNLLVARQGTQVHAGSCKGVQQQMCVCTFLAASKAGYGGRRWQQWWLQQLYSVCVAIHTRTYT